MVWGAVSPSLAKQGVSSSKAISIGMRFCSLWRSHVSTICDLSPSSKITTLSPHRARVITDYRQNVGVENGLDCQDRVQTSTQLNTCGISFTTRSSLCACRSVEAQGAVPRVGGGHPADTGPHPRRRAARTRSVTGDYSRPTRHAPVHARGRLV